MKEDFKEKIKNIFIPSIQNMIIKEKNHLMMLKKRYRTNEETKKFISNSEQNLEYLNGKLYEYTEYINKTI